jgi:hypothetical protein
VIRVYDQVGNVIEFKWITDVSWLGKVEVSTIPTALAPQC